MISQLHALPFTPRKETFPHLTRSLGARESVWAFWRREESITVACLWTPDHPVRSPVITPIAPFRVHVAHKLHTAFVVRLICGTFTDLRNLRGHISYFPYCYAAHIFRQLPLLRQSGENSCILNDSSLLRYSTRVCWTLILYFLLSRMHFANTNKNTWKQTVLWLRRVQ